MTLKAQMIVDSIRWSLERKGIPVYIEHKGDGDAGAILFQSFANLVYIVRTAYAYELVGKLIW